MTLALFIAVYAGLVCFAVGCARRIVQYAKNPIHLRWELYPVPHEDPRRVEHGGSYFETGDWWTKPRHSHHAGELRVMVPEILFLKGLWEFNRRLWLPSFLFHMGLYLSIATGILITIGAIVPVGAVIPATGPLGPFLAHLCRAAGYAGAGFTIVGAILLLIRRIVDPELKNYTKPADIFNLLFFIVTFACLTAGYSLASPNVVALTRALATADTRVSIAPLFAIGLILAAALVAYIPFTHMSHFIAKYFTYHAVRWDDGPNVRGGSIEARVAEYLTYRPTWSAAHVGADGKRNWAEIVTTNPAQGGRK